MIRQERRLAPRVPIGLYVSQQVGETSHRCFATSLSRTGIYLERVAGSPDRHSDAVQIEVPLPGAERPLQIRGRVVYDCVDALFHGSAIEFEWMSREDQVALHHWLSTTRRDADFPFGEVVDAGSGVHIFRPPPKRPLH